MQDADFAFHEGIDPLQPFADIADLKNFLLLRDPHREVRGDRVGKLAGVVDLIERHQDFRRDLFIELHILLELGNHRARQGFQFGGVAGVFLNDQGLGLEEIFAVDELGYARPRTAFDQHLNRAVGQFKKLEYRADRTHPMDIVGRGIVLAGVLQVEKKIRNRVKRQMEKTQREYYLNEQLKAIQKELGETEEGRDEVGEFEERIKKTRLSKEATEKAMAELKKLRNMSPMSAESTVVRNYLDWILSIPWKSKSKVKKDILLAQKVLDDDHYGLKKVKERILEYLAVQTRTAKMKGPILCLVGPPGVGKTSLGKSIAHATGRKFVRMSLGGVRDEAEIRGHRRTYIGSMPGKIIQSMKKAKKSNPLFLLDEVDKIGADWRGDPASALLEVLDPEQNFAFTDHYLEVEYDLSDVMFVTTANTTKIPQALLDRMEIIRISGYTEDEKVQIAKRHLIQKQIEAHALKKGEWSISDAALRDIIRY